MWDHEELPMWDDEVPGWVQVLEAEFRYKAAKRQHMRELLGFALIITLWLAGLAWACGFVYGLVLLITWARG